MRSFQKKRGWRNIMQSRPVLALLIVILLFFAWGVFRFTGKMRVTRENRQIASNKLAELQKEKEKLSGDIARLETPEGVEASIREKFGFAREGEEVIVVVEDKNKLESKPPQSSGFWSWFLFWRK